MYDFYTDGGHWWLKVSLDEIKKLLQEIRDAPKKED